MIRQGDALALLREMPDGSVRCCVTSPPYWGLRDYGTATWDGGDPGCKHAGRLKPRQDTNGETGAEHGRFKATRGTQPGKAAFVVPIRELCQCGARRVDAQLGLERTPEEYVSRLVEVFREVRRVLADDGTLWLNLGDSYATGAGSVGNRPGGGAQGDNWEGAMTSPNRMPLPGLKPKDLVGIPWRVAFALQADGWWLRSDIIWAKPNPMPESVTDRPTKAHEYLFLLAKSERYYYDAAAIREPFSDERQGRDYKSPDGWDTTTGRGGHGAFHKDGREKGRRASERNRGGRTDGFTKPNNIDPSANGGRNRRSVWTIATQPFPEAHFAVMPEALVEPCILAGSAPGDTVLDPFVGSGTVGAVALRHGRTFRGIELKAEYADMARRRISGPLFAAQVAQP